MLLCQNSRTLQLLWVLSKAILYKYAQIVPVDSLSRTGCWADRADSREWSVMDLSKKILRLNHFLAKYLARYQRFCQNITKEEEEEVKGMREKKHYCKKKLFFFSLMLLFTWNPFEFGMPYDNRSELKSLFWLIPHKHSSSHPPQIFLPGKIVWARGFPAKVSGSSHQAVLENQGS